MKSGRGGGGEKETQEKLRYHGDAEDSGKKVLRQPQLDVHLQRCHEWKDDL